MKLENIQNLWDNDCKIDPISLHNESLNISKLHSKYIRILSSEKMILKQHEISYKILYKKKFEFYTQGETKESKEKNWILPEKGCVLKQESALYLESDDNLCELSLKISLQKEKILILEDILKSIHQRNFMIKNAIDFIKFQAGEM